MLAHAVVTAPRSSPDRWVMFLHGILGQGNNWRGFARKLVDAHPTWGAVLIDLRCHGRSLDEAPPDTGRNAARELLHLEVAQRADAVIGHSFGGKVALHYLDERDGELGRAIIVDANPGPRPNGRGSESTTDIVDLLGSLTGPFADRQSFVSAFTSRGHTREIAEWLAMNLEPRGDGLVLRTDVPRIRALLEDHLQTDLWHVVEHPPGRVALTMVVGGKSSVYDASERAKLADVAAASGGRVEAVTIEEAGHWVHVDAPDALHELLLLGTRDLGR